MKDLLRRLNALKGRKKSKVIVTLRNGQKLRLSVPDAIDIVSQGGVRSVDFERKDGQGLLPELLADLVGGEDDAAENSG